MKNTALLHRSVVLRPELTAPIVGPHATCNGGCKCGKNCHEQNQGNKATVHDLPSEADPEVTDAQLDLIATKAFRHESFRQEELIGGHGGCCGDDDSICHCACHDRQLPGMIIEHCAPCCEQSPCGLNIKIHSMQVHLQTCEACQRYLKAKAFQTPPKPVVKSA